MAAYYNEDDGVRQKLTSAVWLVEMHGDRLFGRIDCSLKEALTAEETEALRDWIIGQCSDGLCEGFEQQPIDTMDGELFVSFWNSGDDYVMRPRASSVNICKTPKHRWEGCRYDCKTAKQKTLN